MILQYWVMTVVGIAGIVWYRFSSTEAWPVLGYFVTLCAVGSVSVIACYSRGRPLLLLAGGLNGIAIGLFGTLQVMAFALSPGSGIAAFPFLVVPLAINVISLRWVSDEINGINRPR